MHELNAIRCLPEHYLGPHTPLGLLEWAVLAVTAIEDERGPLACALAPVRWVRDPALADGQLALHLRARIGRTRGRVRTKTDADSAVARAAFADLRAFAPAAVSAAWWERLARDLRTVAEQQVCSQRTAAGRYRVALDGLRAGEVLGGGRQWTAETSRGVVGRSGSLSGAARRIQVAWGFPDTAELRWVACG